MRLLLCKIEMMWDQNHGIWTLKICAQHCRIFYSKLQEKKVDSYDEKIMRIHFCCVFDCAAMLLMTMTMLPIDKEIFINLNEYLHRRNMIQLSWCYLQCKCRLDCGSLIFSARTSSSLWLDTFRIMLMHSSCLHLFFFEWLEFCIFHTKYLYIFHFYT